jgi:DNA-binding transcriptional LysR family regulator
MDVDLAHVRAFVVTAERLHFGRAAADLFLTQQALSKRIQRLERALGERLFTRDRHGVALNSAGRRFLPYARQLLATADAAAAAARLDPRPLRVDAFGPVQAPLRMLRGLIERTPELLIELSMRRSTAAALSALQRGEIDAAFGRVHDLAQPWPAGLAHRLVLLAPAAAAVGPDHPLARASVLGPAELRGYGLWLAAAHGPAEVVGWFRRFAEHLGIPLDTSGHHLGVDDVIEDLRNQVARVGLLGVDGPTAPGVVRVPLAPVPSFPWSLVWREGDAHPLLELLLGLIQQTAPAEGWLAHNPGRNWLPEPDLADLRRQQPSQVPGAASARGSASLAG